jgi:splicing factor 3A subunit 2
MAPIDFQHREGSKIGSGGVLSESQAAQERRERLRKLALETIDISKDPYFMRNHLGGFECKLCLTLHQTEGNYLAHTQGKRHQSNLGRRAAMDATAAKATTVTEVVKKRVIRIGILIFIYYQSL